MRIIMPAIAVTVLAMLAASAQTAAAPAAKPIPGTCASLARDYDNVSKDLAENDTASLGDNSASRATLRAMEDANSFSQAKITLDLMRDYKCPLPKTAPYAGLYMLPALTCANDRSRATGSESPASCDKSTWKRPSEQ